MSRLLLDERILRDGRRACTWAEIKGSHVLLVDDDGTSGLLTATALERVMMRYGKPLDPAVCLESAAIDPPPHSVFPRSAGVIDVGQGRRLRRLRHHAPVDAEGRDYLVWERPNDVPIAVIAAHATAALRYLVMRLSAERNPSEI